MYHVTEKEKPFWNERTFCSDGHFACSVGDASTEVIRAADSSQFS
jgi:REP element-mobilizing transposase RayT